MFFQRITRTDHPMYAEALKLYQISFPPHEQREQAAQDAIVSDDQYHFDLIYDGDVFIGLMLYWEHDSFIYVEHFCILPEMRNKGYGQSALALLSARQKTLLLEIDPPVDSISIRRKGFYERCGFVQNDFDHVHPPYHKGNQGYALGIMTHPTKIAENVFLSFRQYLHNRVMKDALQQ